MKKYYLILALLCLYLSSFTQNIIPDFSDLDGQSSFSRFYKIQAMDDHLAMLFYDQTDQLVSELVIFDKDGLIKTTVNLRTDTTVVDVDLSTDGENLILIGKTFNPTITLDSAEQASRLFTYKKIDVNGNVLVDNLVPINPQDIGFTFSSLVNGIIGDVVVYTPDSRVTSANENLAIEIVETFNLDQDNNLRQYNNTFNIFTPNTKVRKTIIDTSIYRTIADVLVIDSFAYLYALSGDELNNLQNVHRITSDGIITATDRPEGIYFAQRLIQYAERMDNKIVEVAALSKGPLLQEIGATKLTILDKKRNELQSKIIADNRAPFGKSSLCVDNNNSIYVATVDVINRANLPMQIQKLNADDLTETWNIPLSRETFGLFQSMAPTSDGGLVVVGSELLPNRQYEMYVTKIDFSGTVSTTSVLSQTEDWLLGPNPTTGLLYLKEKYLSREVNMTYEVFDQQGRLLQKNALTNSYIDISSISEGAYILQLKNAIGKVISCSKIVKI